MDDDDEDARSRWIWRFVRGALFSVIVSAAAVAAISIFVLPPPEPPAPEPDQSGPQMIGGIEVSSAPAYSTPAASSSSETPGTPADAEPSAPAAQSEEAVGPIELSGPAIAVNAAPFETDPQAPLVAIVVDDVASAPLLHETLFAMDVPLTVGVVVGGGGDQVTAAAAREAGFEVLAELPLVPPGQSAGGALEYGASEEAAAEQTLTLLQRLPMAVAVARPLAAQAPPNASVLRGMLGALAPLGFAYVDHGLAPSEDSIAAHAGTEAIIGVSRFTVPAGADAAAVHAVLDRASAAAERVGSAVVFAPPSEALILALELWAGAGSVNLTTPAPLSAVILRQQAGDLSKLFAEPAPPGPAPDVSQPQASLPAPEPLPLANVPAQPAN